MGSLKPSHETHLMHRSMASEPHKVVSAKGHYLTLESGETILDACGGAAVACIGGGNQEVIDAMTCQAQQASYVHTQAYGTDSGEQLADSILEGSPHGLEKAFFVSGGSEAVEAALKLARQFHFERNDTQRIHFVSRQQSYHGSTMAAMSVSSNLPRKVPYEGFGHQQVSWVTPAYAYRYQLESETEEQFAARLVQELEDEFLRVGPDKVAAFIAETVVGATSGCVTPPKGYFRGVRKVCDKYGVLLILDEVMCGTGRTGTYFAFEQEEDVVPDILTLAKGLGGGYASIAGVVMHEKVVDVLRSGTSAFNHGHTYQAHPIACATALAVQRIIRRDGLVTRCAKMGKLLEAKLRSELSQCKSVGDIRGRGLFWGIEFVKDAKTKEAFDPRIGYGAKVQQAAFEKGVAIYPGAMTIDGRKGDNVLLAPPYTVTEEELSRICAVVREAITGMEAVYITEWFKT